MIRLSILHRFKAIYCSVIFTRFITKSNTYFEAKKKRELLNNFWN